MFENLYTLWRIFFSWMTAFGTNFITEIVVYRVTEYTNIQKEFLVISHCPVATSIHRHTVADTGNQGTYSLAQVFDEEGDR